MICFFYLTAFSSLWFCWISGTLITICFGIIFFIMVNWSSICFMFCIQIFSLLGRFWCLTFVRRCFMSSVLSPGFSLILISLILFFFASLSSCWIDSSRHLAFWRRFPFMISYCSPSMSEILSSQWIILMHILLIGFLISWIYFWSSVS